MNQATTNWFNRVYELEKELFMRCVLIYRENREAWRRKNGDKDESNCVV